MGLRFLFQTAANERGRNCRRAINDDDERSGDAKTVFARDRDIRRLKRSLKAHYSRPSINYSRDPAGRVARKRKLWKICAERRC